jgi:hypothetical protein
MRMIKKTYQINSKGKKIYQKFDIYKFHFTYNNHEEKLYLHADLCRDNIRVQYQLKILDNSRKCNTKYIKKKQ